MIRTAVTVESELGLHARAAARLVRLTSGYHSQIRIARAESDQGIDARSILGILLLAAARGTILYLSVDGDDEKEAAAAMLQYFQSGFSENQ